MSATFLAAAAARANDASHHAHSNIFSSPDLIFQLLLHLPLHGRMQAAAVCVAWLDLTRRTAELYTVCKRGLLNRRAPRRTLDMFRSLLGDHTTLLDLSNVRGVDDDLITSYVFNKSLETARMPRLRTLNLSGCEIGDLACLSVRSAARCGMTSLRELHLWAASDVTDQGIEQLTAACPALEVVDLRMCGEVTGACVATLALNCPALRQFWLKSMTGCGVADAGLHSLGAGCKELRVLDISGGRCTDEGVRALAAGCSKLERLHLAGNKRVGDAAIAALACACPHLRFLDLYPP